MAYQQWNHRQSYQAIPESRPLLMQPWQQEYGCPMPRPRSFSLGSRPTGTDLMEVSTKRVFNTNPIILPVDSNHNYCYNSTTSSKSRSKRNKCRWAMIIILLAASSLTILGWWKLRGPATVVDQGPANENSPPTPLAAGQQQYQQHHQQQPNSYQQQSPYHPLPPPPAALVPQGSQQQQYYGQQPAWQSPPPQQQPYQQHAPLQPDAAHYNNYHQQPYKPHYGQSQQQYQASHYGQQQYQHGHVQQQQQHQANNHYKPEMANHHQGEPVPRKSWMMEHVETPTIPQQENDLRHQQHHTQQRQPNILQPEQPPIQQAYQQPYINQQPHQPQQPYAQQPQEHHQQYYQPAPMEPVLNRQEERAKARNQARTMNPIKNSTKVENDDGIWEEVRDETIPLTESIIGITLRLEPAEFSFIESILASDGTTFITSFEDDEDVTVEIVEDA